jgi:regulator of sirC expression with transglutaminase-like and TPR domain
VSLAGLSDGEIDLAEAALLIAAEEQPGLDPDLWLQRLDQMAAHLWPRLQGVHNELDRLTVLSDFLTREAGLRGNNEDYYDARNSYLNEVLDRGLGIPISLSILWIEVGRRVGIPLQGIGFPGHFLVRHARFPQILLDPFDEGRLLTQDDCRTLLERVSGGRMTFHPDLLKPVGPRHMLLRLLGNLRAIYIHRGHLPGAIAVLDRMRLLDPEDPDVLRDRGLLRLQWGDLAGGIEDLEELLEIAPFGLDEEGLVSLVAETRRRLDMVH